MKSYRVYFEAGLPHIACKMVLAEDFQEAFIASCKYAKEKGATIDSIMKINDEFINLPQIGQVPQKPE